MHLALSECNNLFSSRYFCVKKCYLEWFIFVFSVIAFIAFYNMPCNLSNYIVALSWRFDRISISVCVRVYDWLCCMESCGHLSNTSLGFFSCVICKAATKRVLLFTHVYMYTLEYHFKLSVVHTVQSLGE